MVCSWYLSSKSSSYVSECRVLFRAVRIEEVAEKADAHISGMHAARAARPFCWAICLMGGSTHAHT
eukprot:3514672-Amphidinium_carterae.2